jgi:hypothetical protein
VEHDHLAGRLGARPHGGLDVAGHR